MEMTKKLLATLAMGAATLACWGQQATIEMPKNSIFIEWGGASDVLGLNYEQRLSHNPHWGWRVGMAWGYGSESIRDFKYSSSERRYMALAGVNYLSGRRRSKLELGAGVNGGLYNTHAHVFEYSSKSEAFAYYFYGTVGYRYQAPGGFQFRTGLSPRFSFGGKHGVDSEVGVFYLSVGWSF